MTQHAQCGALRCHLLTLQTECPSSLQDSLQNWPTAAPVCLHLQTAPPFRSHGNLAVGQKCTIGRSHTICLWMQWHSSNARVPNAVTVIVCWQAGHWQQFWELHQQPQQVFAAIHAAGCLASCLHLQTSSHIWHDSAPAAVARMFSLCT